MKVLLGMSGGVDSTYAAHRLRKLGHEVEGAVLIMHAYTERQAAIDAAKSVGIPLHIIDCTEVFRSRVQTAFASEYRMGRTPNPCVICNSEVKFRILADTAKELGFDKIATGHYAKICEENGRYCIKKGKDAHKDQSYVLWRLPQDILSMLIFPLSEDEKTDVKEDARSIGLSSADREESQEICFLPDGNHPKFIEEFTGKADEPGWFVDEDGNRLGSHPGITHFTVGQRKGLGISLGKRMFITKIDAEEKTVTLSSDPNRCTEEFSTFGAAFGAIGEPAAGTVIRAKVKVRYLAPPVEAEYTYLGDGKGKVHLLTPARAVTPGQSAVFYDEDRLLFGTFIGETTV